MDATIWAGLAAGALACAALLRLAPAGRPRADGLDAARLAALRAGPKAAVALVVVELHLAGLLEASRDGRLRTLTTARRLPEPTPVHRAVRVALVRPLSCADVASRPAVLRARHALRADLVARGLSCGAVRRAAAAVTAVAAAATATTAALQGAVLAGASLALLALAVLALPSRTVAGHRTLRRLRRLHPLTRAASSGRAVGTGPGAADAVALLVALHGRKALRGLLPAFAARAGLLGGRAARDVVGHSEDLWGGLPPGSRGDLGGTM